MSYQAWSRSFGVMPSSTLCERVASAIGQLGFIPDGVGEFSLRYFARERSCLADPIAEGRPEAVCCGSHLHAAEQRIECHV